MGCVFFWLVAFEMIVRRFWGLVGVAKRREEESKGGFEVEERWLWLWLWLLLRDDEDEDVAKVKLMVWDWGFFEDSTMFGVREKERVYGGWGWGCWVKGLKRRRWKLRIGLVESWTHSTAGQKGHIKWEMPNANQDALSSLPSLYPIYIYIYIYIFLY